MVKELRSFIHEKIPEDLRVDLDLLSRRRDLRGEEKAEEVIKLFRKYDVGDISQLGPGTNRYGLKLDGFVIKVATDKEGKIDNLKEFKMAKVLVHVPHTYEVSENGILLTAEYVQPFESYTEMMRYSDRIREILTEWSSVYLIGDAGITSKNFANWGLRVGTEDVVCLDFAYIYDVSSNIFVCRKCNAGSMLVPNKDFTKLVCPNPACQKDTTFEDIRSMISNEYHRKQIGDLSEEGYIMTKSHVLTELDIKRSAYLIKRRKGKIQQTIDENEDVSNNDNIEEENEMFKNELVINELVGKVATPYDSLVVDAIPIGQTASAVEVEAEPVVDGVPNDPDMFPEDEESDVAFSAPVDQDAASTVMELLGVPVDDEPEEEKNKVRFKQRFCDESNRAVSKFTGYIVDHLHSIDLFNKVKSELMVKKIYADQFYKELSSAIFRALVEALKFDAIMVENRNGEGTHREYRADFELVNDRYEYDSWQEDLLGVIERFYNTKGINSLPDLSSMISEYNRIYSGEYGEFDLGKGWVAGTITRLTKHLPMTPSGRTIMLNSILGIWVDPDELDEEEEEIDQEVDIEDEVDEVDDEEEEEETDAVPSKSLRVEIFDNDTIDVIRIISEDSFGDISIPIYTNLTDAPETSNVVIDERNGCWDWIAHMIPDVMFRTKDPDKYVSYNSSDWDIGGALAVIIGTDEEGWTIIGLFVISGIYAVDNDDNYIPIHDESLLNKLNAVVMRSFGTGGLLDPEISHKSTSMSMTEFIHDEDYVNEFFVTVVEEDDEETDQEEESVYTEADPEVDDEEESADEVADEDAEDTSDESETSEEPTDEGVKVTADIVDDIVNQIKKETESESPTERAVDSAISAIEAEEAALAALEEDIPAESPAKQNKRNNRDSKGRFVAKDPIVPDPGDDDGSITPRRRRKK